MQMSSDKAGAAASCRSKVSVFPQQEQFLANISSFWLTKIEKKTQRGFQFPGTMMCHCLSTLTFEKRYLEEGVRNS